MNNNYLPFDLEKALAGDPYGVLNDSGEFIASEYMPHRLPEWDADYDWLVRAGKITLPFEEGKWSYDKYTLVMLPPEPKVEYRYANEYPQNCRYGGRLQESIELCKEGAKKGLSIGIIRYTYLDGRLAPELTVRIEDYRK